MPRLCAAILAVSTLVACGPPPDVERAHRLLRAGDYPGARKAADAELERDPKSAAAWRVKIRALLLAGDSGGAVKTYAAWRTLRGEHDRAALDRMAKLTLWRGLVAPSVELKVAAIRAVERLEIERLADEVGQLVAADDDYVAAVAAVALLSSHPYARQVAAGLLESRDERARAAVVEGIGKKIPDLAGAEIRAALSDRSEKVRRAAVAAVVKLKAAEDSGALATLAREDSDREVRARALRALAAKAYVASGDLVSAALGDPYLGVRVAALEVASRKLGSAGRQILLKASRDSDTSLALRAAVLIGPGPGWQSLIDRALASERWTDRAAAAGAAVETLGRQGALVIAGRAIIDPRLEVRLATARLLLRLGQRDRAIAELARAASATPPHIGAATELARLGDPRGLRALERAAASKDRAARAAAIAAHRTAGHISDPLVAALADDLPKLRLAAAAAILDAIGE